MRIFTASHHSFIDLSRVDDDLYGPMVEIEYQHPECDVRHRVVLSREAARKLAEHILMILPWLEPQPYAAKHPKEETSVTSGSRGLHP